MTLTRVGTARAGLVAVVALVLLAGCAGRPTPARTSHAASPTPHATPTPTPQADRARVVIDGRAVRVYDRSGDVAVEVPFSVEATTAASRLGEALHVTAETSTVTTDRCYQELTESSWGGLHIFSATDGLTRPGGAQFYATADGADASDAYPIELPSGQSIGDAKSQVLAANASAPSFSDGGTIDLHYDVVAGTARDDQGEYYGALARIVGGKLASIDSPIYYSRPC